MEDEPINQNYLIGCDTIENSPSINYSASLTEMLHMYNLYYIVLQTDQNNQ